jgi:hypothetical protein
VSARYLVRAVPPGHPPIAPIQLAAGDTLRLTFELTASETTVIEFGDMYLLEHDGDGHHTVRAVLTDPDHADHGTEGRHERDHWAVPPPVEP